MKARKQKKLQEAVVRLRANVGFEQDSSGTGEEPKNGSLEVLHLDADKASANVAEKIEQARMERTSKVDSDVSFGRKLNLCSAFPAITPSSANATKELDKIVEKVKDEGGSCVPSELLAASGTASPVETIEKMSFSLEDEKREKKRAILREWKARRAAEAAVASAKAQHTGKDDEQDNNDGSEVFLDDAMAKMRVAEKIEQTRIPRMGRIDRNMTFGHKLNLRNAFPAVPTSPTEAANELETAFKKFKVDSGSRKRSELQIGSVAASQKTAAVATVEIISGVPASLEDGGLEKQRAVYREVMGRRSADDAAVSTKVQCVRGSSRLPVLKVTPINAKNKDENKSATNTPNIPTWGPHVKNEVRPSDHPVTTGHSAETPAKAGIAASRHRQGRNSEADKENSTPTVKGTNLHMPAKRLPLRLIP
ncbi:hypothetical protein A0H81_06981 [Grifola frondosa]|uniref:Uncharacterized protein n=1 Tax=Grifola frondosa TaxID=5627 RepID=A0A1C7MAK6_GRIFR|nr:hypothetical protein A0H81_06981 [Grifola frondosa]